MGITFVAVYRGTRTQLHHQIGQEIAGDASELSLTLTWPFGTTQSVIDAALTLPEPSA